jgi:pimeloyl-ACP methyl ester carboxylesterase
MDNDVKISERAIELQKPGIRTRVLETGERNKRLLLLLHGNPDNADEWLALMKIVGKTHRCIAPDIPGYGKSPEPPKSFDYSEAAQVEFVDALLSELAVNEKITLIVHDIGGVMGIAWAGRNIERLNGLVITNTVAFTGFEWFANALTWSDTTPRGRLRARIGMWAIGLSGGSLFKKIFAKQNPQLPLSELERITNTFALNKDAKRSALRQFPVMTSPLFFKNYEAYLQRITSDVPCVVVWGDHDPYVPIEWANSFAKAPVEIIPNGGHWVAITAPEKLAELAYKYVLG